MDYGRNWDAVLDGLMEMVAAPLHIKIVGLENIERKFGDSGEKLIEVLKRAKHCNYDRFSNHITFEIVTGDTIAVLN